MSFVDAVPIEPVIEVRADCSDRAKATAALADALAVARGPRRSSRPDAMWKVTVRVTLGAKNTRSADAQIVDDDGRVVAERTVADNSRGSCLALARAVGAWTQLVLDDELQRTKDEAAKAEAAEQVKSSATLAANVPEPAALQADQRRDVSAAPPKPFEVGAMMFLRNNVGSSGVVGASPFVVIGVGSNWLLRPSLAVGSSTTEVTVAADKSYPTFYGGRFDFCRRIPGNYIDRKGIELDACAGFDGGALIAGDRAVVRLSAGPAFTVRGELSENVGLELRGMTGVNLTRAKLGSEGAPPPVVAGAEVGASVRFR